MLNKFERILKVKVFYSRNLVIFTDDDAIQETIAELHLESETVKQNINVLESKVSTPKEKELIVTLKKINNDLDIYKNQIIALVSEGKKEEALDLIDESSVSIHEDFFDILSNIVVTFDSKLESSLKSMIKDFRNDIITGMSILGVGIIVTRAYC